MEYDDLEYGTNEIGDYTVVISQDDLSVDETNPRSWDNVGTMVCWHNRYILGDEQPDCSPDEYLEMLVVEECGLDEGDYYNDDGDFDQEAYDKRVGELVDKMYVMLPLYLYDHSGITMSTSRAGYPFNCPWDAGQVGFIYASKAKLHDERIESSSGSAILRHEVETYDLYLTGQVYQYYIEHKGTTVDSCCGFLGMDHVRQSAVEALEWYIDKERQDHQEQVKIWIRNKVPLEYRV